MLKQADMKVGMRVGFSEQRTFTKDSDIIFFGTCYNVHGAKATIKRDDGANGAGMNIPDYGQGWDSGFEIGEGWTDGEYPLFLIDEGKCKNWKERLHSNPL
jgi:hypothetical protein